MLNIAIDGVAGSGKSSLAERLAQRLRIFHFNTGMVYRAIACHYLATVGEEVNEKNISTFVKNIDVHVWFDGMKQMCLVDGADYSKLLRAEKTSVFVAKISPYVQIREIVRKIQRNFASDNNCVMEGRDIGRVVLKNSQFKFFLTASVEARAKRRFDELDGSESLQEVMEEIKNRDYEDINREEGALISSDDAIIIDNSDLTLEQTVDECYNIIIRRDEYDG